jgi:Ca2+-binding EF-hand superfamily protein
VRFAETRTVDLTDEEEVKNLIRFGERFQRGDISGSGRLTTSDALEILRYIAGLENVIEGDERAEAAADVNGDGKIDTADAMRILRVVAGLA